MFKILVIDDDKNIRFVMKEVLENSGYTVLTASNGENAFDIMEKESVDLIVVDIMFLEFLLMNTSSCSLTRIKILYGAFSVTSSYTLKPSLLSSSYIAL